MTRRIAGLAVLAVVLAGVAAIISRLNLATMAAAWRAASRPWLIATAIVNLLSAAIDALRWRAILGAVSPVSMLSTVEALLVGWLANTVLPLKLGEGTRAWALARRERLPVATVLSTVVVDRAVDVAGFVGVLILTSMRVPLPPSADRVRVVAVVALVVAILVVLTLRRTGAANHVIVRRVLDGLAVLGHQHRLAGVLALAAAAWCVRLAVVWCALRAFDLALPIAAAASVLVTVNLGIAAIAAPGNLGVFEVSVIAGLAPWQVPAEVALSVGVGMHAAELLPILALALVARRVTRDVVDVP